GPFWTDLAGKIPEESSRFNFVLTAGFGVSYFLTDRAALNVAIAFSIFQMAARATRTLDSMPACLLAGFPSSSKPGVRRMIGRILSRPLISSVLAMTLGLGAGCSH